MVVVQGDLDGAVGAYLEASELWPNQTVIFYSLANALLELGRLDEARQVSDWLAGPLAGRPTQT